jgi:dTDP-4-amino-4,6-dideoxygalactose transaminase
VGVNSRLDEIQAAMLRVKLKHMDAMTEHKRELANIYFAELPSFVNLPVVNLDEFDAFHIFGIRSTRRNVLKEFLLQHNIKTEIHYPIPPHKQRAMQGLLSGQYPVAQELHDTELSLPISYGHTAQDIYQICKTIQKFES